MKLSKNIDQDTLNSWHALAAIEDLGRIKTLRTKLLGVPVQVEQLTPGEVTVRHYSGATEEFETLPCLIQYGYVWTTFGQNPKPLFKLDNYDEQDRRNIHAATFGVNVSAPRAVENFLDMAHFAFVHTGYLGEEPHTEIPDYEIELDEEVDEIIARDCRSLRSQRSEGQSGAVEVSYVYRIMQPFLTLLTMASAVDPSREDTIALFVQPVDEDNVNAHMLLSVIDSTNDDSAVRRFQQIVFGQDKPILENQFPKRMPLDPRAETPIRADKMGVAYRRWLRKKQITYGVIPAPV